MVCTCMEEDWACMMACWKKSCVIVLAIGCPWAPDDPGPELPPVAAASAAANWLAVIAGLLCNIHSN